MQRSQPGGMLLLSEGATQPLERNHQNCCTHYTQCQPCLKKKFLFPGRQLLKLYYLLNHCILRVNTAGNRPEEREFRQTG